MDILILLAAFALAATFTLFWTLGLFAGRSPPWRTLWVGVASLGYVGAQCLVAVGSTYQSAILENLAAAWMHLRGVSVWSIVMLLSALFATGRLLTFRRGDSRHRQVYAWLSWILVLALSATSAKLMFGIKPPPGPVESLAVAWFAWRMDRHKGNLAHYAREVLASIALALMGLSRLIHGRLP
ncbi:phage holin family protein [Luteibacter mycovicinus]|uniref:phage holin family protein n=1 Tax=Luteibacter mycovicinus TaxID=1500890 RepID=UPI0005632C48|nr:phage holin family protein [Luteibacter sp. 9143a]